MAEYLFLLSKENLGLAKEEAISLVSHFDLKMIENLLLLTSKKKIDSRRLSERLAYTKQISQLLFIVNIKNIQELLSTNKGYPLLMDRLKVHINNFEWNKYYKTSFRITVHNGPKLFEKHIADLVWQKIERPKVDLKHPKTEFEFFFTDKQVLCSILLYKNKSRFQNRRAHLRPELHPSSLHPKLARCLVNLSGVPDNETLLDPFCGSGGILIESGLMKIRSIGYDLDPRMLAKAKENLKYYNIYGCKLKVQDFLKIRGKFNYIAADLPYGLNSNILMENKHGRWPLALKRAGDKKLIDIFFQKVFTKLSLILKKRAVIVLPDFLNYNKCLKKTRIRIIKKFDVYVHSSLTRNILILEKI